MGVDSPPISETTYRAWPGVSGTQIKTLLTSPAMLGVPVEVTDAMRLGTLVHSLVLGTTPSAVVAPFTDFRTNEAKAWKAARAAEGLDVVTQETWDLAQGMVAALSRHETAAAILFGDDGENEVPFTWEYCGTPCKGRIDRIWTGRVVDLKTIAIRGDDFEDACHKALGAYGVHFQLIHYRLGLQSNRPDNPLDLPPVAIYVEKDAPHRVAVIELSPADVLQGIEGCFEAYRRWADCTEAGVWPDGSPEGIRPSRIPQWSWRTWDRAINGGPYDATETIAGLETLIGDPA